MNVYHINALAGMRLFLADASVDAIVTDPPYELGFMGKGWDSTGIAYSVELWREALRVLKPGGHLLAFSGSRTYHRMACAIEDAGFDIRDQIMWVYGSGFPKSLDVSKAIDKAAGALREVVGVARHNANRADREIKNGGSADDYHFGGERVETAPATDAARQWDGWGTALKPAHEPICVARKPLVGTVAANVLAHGTGALNIDGCRVDAPDAPDAPVFSANAGSRYVGVMNGGETSAPKGRTTSASNAGRWPANLIHDGSDDVLAALPSAPGRQGALTGNGPSARAGAADQVAYGTMDRRHAAVPRREEDRSAARFFYCAKASKADRGPGNDHPTVKPSALMQYLVRLVTPPGGHVLDPFNGSGTTALACLREGFSYTGFDLDAHYVAITNARLAAG